MKKNAHQLQFVKINRDDLLISIIVVSIAFSEKNGKFLTAIEQVSP